MKQRFVKAMTVIMVVCFLGGCGSGNVQESMVLEPTQTEVLETEEAEAETETKEAKEAAILMVSFGTSYNDSRTATIDGIENAVAQDFSDYEVRRAFTSQIIIDKLKERDNLEIDNVTQALERAVADGIKELVVQPTHLMDGYEYQDILEELTAYVDQFDKILLGEPLLASDEDFDAVVKAITETTAAFDDTETAICFMGHGTEADSNAVYAKMQEKLHQAGYENYYIGTVEAAPALEDVVAALKEKAVYKKVVLQPLMVVAGDHANNDMAGAEEDSWKSVLEKEGYEVECVLEGLGQIPAIQDIYIKHIRTAIAEESAFTGVAQVEGAEANGDLADGVYAVEVESDSSMFKIVKAELAVVDGSMSADITLSGTGYSKLYMGTAEQAAEAAETDYIPFEEDATGAYTYNVPVAALDQPIECAAFSKKKETWYDRQITFLSPSPSLQNGTYLMDITFAGGSGKAEILSPAMVTIEGETVTATLQWSSENYDYMIVDDEKYLPVSTENGSLFEIPVSSFDEEIEVIADTVAMSRPREIEYTITFHSDTMKPAE